MLDAESVTERRSSRLGVPPWLGSRGLVGWCLDQGPRAEWDPKVSSGRAAPACCSPKTSCPRPLLFRLHTQEFGSPLTCFPAPRHFLPGFDTGC